MNWIWPFSSYSGNGEHRNGNGSDDTGGGPDFLCAGVHKGGTTWLYQQLDSHPDFWMPPFKEMHYFDQLSKVDRSSSPRCRDERDLRFHENMKSLSAKSSVDFDHYARLFESKGALLSGDISPNYSTLPGKLIRRIAGYFPNLKVLFMVRDPVERLWSHLSMEVHYRQIESFDATDIEEVNRKLLRRGMLVRSYPSAAVARWRRYVHPDRFRVYFFDDLQRDPAELRRSVLGFLEADPEKPTDQLSASYNSWAGMEKLPLTEKVRSHLGKFFQKELKTCAARLGGAARDWPARYGLSLLLFIWDFLDDSIDLFCLGDWIS